MKMLKLGFIVLAAILFLSINLYAKTADTSAVKDTGHANENAGSPSLLNPITAISAIAALAAAIASWAGFISHLIFSQKEKVIHCTQEWNLRRIDSRQHFWKGLETAYSVFKSTRHDIPEKLDTLIDTVNMPPGLPPPKGRLLNDWPSDNKRYLEGNRAIMWQFVQEVYPSKEGKSGDVMDYSIVPNPHKQSLHESRIRLVAFFEFWSKHLALKHALKVFGHTRRDLAIVSWLDIALRQWCIGDENQGNINLYLFGNRIWKY